MTSVQSGVKEAVEPEDWKAASERICTEMVTLAEKPIRKVADELYETMLISVQDYIRENVDYNLSGELSRLQHALDTTNDALSTVERAIGMHGGMYPSKARVAETAADLIRERDTLLAALSSQAEVMEAMASALEPFAWFAESGSSAQYINSLGDGDDGWCAAASFRASSFLNARTALSQYRSLNGDA